MLFCDEGLGKHKEIAFKLQMRKCIHKMLKYVAQGTYCATINILTKFTWHIISYANLCIFCFNFIFGPMNFIN